MNITLKPDEKNNKEVWWVLQKLKYIESASRKDELLRFVIKPPYQQDDPTQYEQESAILKLEKDEKAITIINSEPAPVNPSIVTFERYYNYDFKIIHPKFDEVYEKYEKQQPEDKKENSVKPLIVGQLVYSSDGSICFKNKIIEIRPQMKTLCILFMENHKKRVDYSTIKDEIIDAKKRSSTSFGTITKYVSELHNLLKKYFKKEVIFNDEDQGYIFDIGKNS